METTLNQETDNFVANCMVMANDIMRLHARKTWIDYDEEADVLYLSVGTPKPAVGIDIGEGLILRYDENRKEVVGLTLIGLRARLLQGLASS